ncbi:hypothetical protein [Streptomyces sp. SID10815]|uniref:hypothetical protein n=1 Tax=Streptomyces sp. SID10815 TaxID=2706027 RepID=UPI0013CD1654|nr:hypothetical protein [Streptomyces sp. SID10815]NEA49826.1 hypothetical protein [Streptomyces sp. SID10815]
MSRARIATALATLGLVLGVSACSNDSGGGADKDGAAGAGSSATPKARAVQDAYRKTVAADSARMTVTSEAVTEGQKVTAHGNGVVDLKDGASTMTVTSQGNRIEQRVVDGILYQKPSGSQRAELPGGKSWMRIDLKRLARSGSAGRTDASDPAEPIGYVKSVRSGDVTRIGEETVDGAATTHYRVNVPVSALAKGDTAQAQELSRQLGSTKLPVDLWLDDQGRMRQERVRMSMKPLAQRTPGKENTRVTSTTVLKFSDFGTDVEVTPPAAADTADMTDKLVKSGGSTAQSG